MVYSNMKSMSRSKELMILMRGEWFLAPHIFRGRLKSHLAMKQFLIL